MSYNAMFYILFMYQEGSLELLKKKHIKLENAVVEGAYSLRTNKPIQQERKA